MKFLLLAFFAGCLLMFSPDAAAQDSKAGTKAADQAIAVLHPTQGSNVHGTVRFVQEKDGVRIVADVEGLTQGKHGFHVHETGNCSSPDAESAGGHFNPTGKQHGAPSDKERHAGDFGNITAGADGRAHYEMTDRMMQLSGPHSIIGRAVIVHANPDDLKSQPTGNAGARLACGVIGIDRALRPR